MDERYAEIFDELHDMGQRSDREAITFYNRESAENTLKDSEAFVNKAKEVAGVLMDKL